MKIPDITTEYKNANLLMTIVILLSLILPYFVYVKEVDKKRLFFQFESLPSHHKSLTGENCSSSGITRSIKSLYNGFINRSMLYNRSGVSFFFILIVQLLLRLVVFNLKSHLVPWVDILQILFTIFLAKYILDLNYCGMSNL
jgi:hypothetical protein